MAYTIPKGWNVNATVPLAKLTPISSDLTFLGTPPIAVAASSTSQSIASATLTQITSMISVYVSGSMTWSSNKVTVALAGRYYIAGYVSYAAATNLAAYYQAILDQNGAAVATGSYSTAQATSLLFVPVRWMAICAAGDTISLFTLQNAGSAKSATGRLIVKWISN